MATLPVRAGDEPAEEVPAVEHGQDEVQVEGGLAGLALGHDEQPPVGWQEPVDPHRWVGWSCQHVVE
jgi:hypothetical protein